MEMRNKGYDLSGGLIVLTKAGHSAGWIESVADTKIAYYMPLQNRRGLCLSVHGELAP